MAKQSQLDRAIATLEGEIEVLHLALAKLRAQQGPKKAAKPKAVAKVTNERVGGIADGRL